MSWDAPSRLNNPAEADYLVEYREAGTRTWLEYGLESSPTTIGYLENGTTYEVRVIVFDTYGDAATGPRSATPTAPDTGDECEERCPPSAPRNLTLTAGDGHINVSWDAPSRLNNPSRADYLVEYRKAGTSRWLEEGLFTGTTATIGFLENGTTYQVRVIVYDTYGHTATTPKSATPNGN